MYDAGDRKDVRRAEKAAKLSARNDAEVLTSLMSNLGGRAWVYRRLEECNIFHTPYVPDSNATAFNCGMQSIGLSLLAQVTTHCPDQYITMNREANERHASSERAGRKVPDGGDSGQDSATDVGDESRTED